MKDSTKAIVCCAIAIVCGVIGFMVDKIDTSQIQLFGQPTVVKVTNGNGESYYVVRELSRIYSFTFGDYYTQSMTGDRYKTEDVDQAKKFETARVAKQWLQDYQLSETVVESIDPEPTLAKADP